MKNTQTIYTEALGLELKNLESLVTKRPFTIRSVGPYLTSTSYETLREFLKENNLTKDTIFSLKEDTALGKHNIKIQFGNEVLYIVLDSTDYQLSLLQKTEDLKDIPLLSIPLVKDQLQKMWKEEYSEELLDTVLDNGTLYKTQQEIIGFVTNEIKKYSIRGTVIEHLKEYAPNALDKFYTILDKDMFAFSKLAMEEYVYNLIANQKVISLSDNHTFHTIITVPNLKVAKSIENGLLELGITDTEDDNKGLVNVTVNSLVLNKDENTLVVNLGTIPSNYKDVKIIYQVKEEKPKSNSEIINEGQALLQSFLKS